MTQNASPSGAGGTEIVATCHGIAVPEAPHLGPGMISALQRGTYERREFEAARAVIHRNARILELGAGSGFVGAAIARNCAPSRIVAFEANPAFIPHIRALYARNRLTDVISVRHAVVLTEPDVPDSVEFLVRGNFLGSGLTVVKNPEKAVPTPVPVVHYDALKAEFPHDVIVMDIEGAEREFFAHADLSGVRTIIFEIHRQIYGRDGMKECRRALASAGFAIDGETSKGGVHVWRRETHDRPGSGLTTGPNQSAVIKTPDTPPARTVETVIPVTPLFAHRIDRIRDAVVVPERGHDAPLACGVFRPDGAFCDLSRA